MEAKGLVPKWREVLEQGYARNARRDSHAVARDLVAEAYLDSQISPWMLLCLVIPRWCASVTVWVWTLLLLQLSFARARCLRCRP